MNTTIKVSFRKSPLLISLVCLGLLLSGCAILSSGPTTGSAEINVPNIPNATVANTPLNVGYKPYVLLDQVIDQRQSPELIKVYDRTLKPRGPIEVATRYAFRSTFRQRGFTITDNAPITVVPTVKKWIVTVTKDQGTAEAVIAIDVLDPSSQAIYSGSYDGFIQFTPTSNEEELRKHLGDSFAKALSQMIADEQLLGVLSAF